MDNLNQIIQKADADAVNLKDSGELSLAAQGLQNLYDQTANMTYGPREFRLNAYVKEINSKADDIYGKGNHITLELVDTNKNEHIDAGDNIYTKHVDGTNRTFHISNVERANNSF